MAVVITNMVMPKNCNDCFIRMGCGARNFHTYRSEGCPLKSADAMIEEVMQKHVYHFERLDFDAAYGLSCALRIIHKYCDK